MIKWCSYCQHYLGETAPHDRYEITHGICRGCLPRAADFSDEDRARIQPLLRFYSDLQVRSLSHTPIDPVSLAEEAAHLGLRPVDLMLGVLQPLLYRIGSLWKQGKVAVGTEHRFSNLCRKLLEPLRGMDPPQAGPPLQVVLVNARGNQHLLGLQMTQVLLATEKVQTLTFLEPPAHLIELLQTLNPQIVAFSAALPEQLAWVEDQVTHLVQCFDPPPHVAIGGPIVASGHPIPPSMKACRSALDLIHLLETAPADS